MIFFLFLLVKHKQSNLGIVQNQERMVRQRALKEFLEFCSIEENLSSENAIEIFDSTYLCLIKCYSDKFEMCRSLACSIFSEIRKHLEKNDYYLSLLVPVIAKRLAAQELVEESEEMRLQLLQQLNYIIDKYKDLKTSGTVKSQGDCEDRLLKPYNDIIDILKICLMNSYPAVLKECCEIIKVTDDIASPSFHYRAEALAMPLMTMLKHRHSPIRIASIEAFGVVALNIYTNADIVKRIIKEISPLLMDPVADVRRECGRVGCLFLLKMRDRYSHFERILPLVLCCLTDEIDEVRDEIEKLWKDAGERGKSN
jgi:dynein assembly factor 5